MAGSDIPMPPPSSLRQTPHTATTPGVYSAAPRVGCAGV